MCSRHILCAFKRCLAAVWICLLVIFIVIAATELVRGAPNNVLVNLRSKRRGSGTDGHANNRAGNTIWFDSTNAVTAASEVAKIWVIETSLRRLGFSFVASSIG